MADGRRDGPVRALEEERARLAGRIAAIDRKIQAARDEETARRDLEEHRARFEKHRDEANTIARHMDARSGTGDRIPEDLLPLPAKVLFLGGASGEWAARSLVSGGTVPGAGGILLIFGDLRILVDPGATTLDNLYAEGVHPDTLDLIVCTHNHWDARRDLDLVIAAAAGRSLERGPLRNRRMHLIAAPSVLTGIPNVDGLVVDDQALHGEFNPFMHGEANQRDEMVAALRKQAFAVPPLVNCYEVFTRLGNRVAPLVIGTRLRARREGPAEEPKVEVVPLPAGADVPPLGSVDLHVRTAHHHETYGVGQIPAIDFVARLPGPPLCPEDVVRIAFLNDTEYRPDLAAQYRVDGLPPFDLLVCNVKTISIRENKEFPGVAGKFTERHLGWQGTLQVVRDFQGATGEVGPLLGPATPVVLRSWGIETLTEMPAVDETTTSRGKGSPPGGHATNVQRTGALVLNTGKLETYKRLFEADTGQPAIIPGRTWVGVAGRSAARVAAPPLVHDSLRPYIGQGGARDFYGIRYLSRVMDDVVRNAKAAAECHPREPFRHILIRGPTGSGKDALAYAIDSHARSARGRAGRLVEWDSHHLVGDDALGKLVGWRSGYFTNVGENPGAFGLAANGTLVIGEADKVRSDVLDNLLGPLGNDRYTPLGKDSTAFTAQVILIWSTDPGDDPSARGARLTTKLNQRLRIQLSLPSLAERPEDIPAILDGWARRDGPLRRPAPPGTAEALARMPWPGNVRMLLNAVRAVPDSDWTRTRFVAEAERLHEAERGLAAPAEGPVAAPPRPVRPLEPAVLDDLARKVLDVLNGAPKPLLRSQVEQGLAALGIEQGSAKVRRALERLQKIGLAGSVELNGRDRLYQATPPT